MTKLTNPAYWVARSWVAVHYAQEAFVLLAASGLVCAALSDAVLHGLVVEFVVPIPVPILAPVFAGIAVGVGTGTCVDREIRSSRSLFGPRAIWVMFLVSAGCAVTVGGSLLGSVSSAAILRNCLAFSALGVVSAVFFGPAGAWTGPSVIGLFLVLFGGARREGLPAWAALLRDDAQAVEIVFAVAAFGVAALLYALLADRRFRASPAWT